MKILLTQTGAGVRILWNTIGLKLFQFLMIFLSSVSTKMRTFDVRHERIHLDRLKLLK